MCNISVPFEIELTLEDELGIRGAFQIYKVELKGVRLSGVGNIYNYEVKIWNYCCYMYSESSGTLQKFSSSLE